MSLRCPLHDVRLELDEVTDEERSIGALDWESVESYVVERWMCPVETCREMRQVSGRAS